MERRVCEGSKRGIGDRGVKSDGIGIDAHAYTFDNRLERHENPLRRLG